MSANFYRAFEDKHRGSRDLIKTRLCAYLPFIQPLALLHPGLPALDLGCGRGEWLELLQDHHIPAQGVDLDDGMLAACRERGFNVINADAVAHLQAQPDHSLLFITGFHIAEHLPFEVLQTLFTQARRVLVPDGLLILETPNPENLVVGTASFYIDPTHQRPLPTQLLGFMAEHHGFARAKIVRLQEETRLLNGAIPNFYDVLGGVSPDYALIAQPAPGADDPPALTQAFAMEKGVTLFDLATGYDEQVVKIGQLQISQDQVQAEMHAQLQQVQAFAQQSAQRADQFAAALQALHASHSWRLTRPLRWLAGLFR